MRSWNRSLFILLLLGVVDARFLDSLSNLGGGSSNSRSKAKAQSAKTAVTDEQAKKYLYNFGYVRVGNSLAGMSPGMSADLSSPKDLLKSAIVKFQEFAGLKKTGELDDQTKQKMAEPRCGVTDVLAISSGETAFKWKKNHITYSIENFSDDLPKDQVRRALAEGYAAWAAVTPLTFEEVASDGMIKVRFVVGNHGDEEPFNGQGGTVAHASPPESGIFHFDDDENWVYMDAAKIASGNYTDILYVAIHEAGHTLGLFHSPDNTSIMAPFYPKMVDDNGNYNLPTLKASDIRDIQDIYGAGSGSWGGSGESSSSPDLTPRFGSEIDIPRNSEVTTDRTPTMKRESWLDGLFGRGSTTTTTTPRPTTMAY